MSKCSIDFKKDVVSTAAIVANAKVLDINEGIISKSDVTMLNNYFGESLASSNPDDTVNIKPSQGLIDRMTRAYNIKFLPTGELPELLAKYNLVPKNTPNFDKKAMKLVFDYPLDLEVLSKLNKELTTHVMALINESTLVLQEVEYEYTKKPSESATSSYLALMDAYTRAVRFLISETSINPKLSVGKLAVGANLSNQINYDFVNGDKEGAVFTISDDIRIGMKKHDDTQHLLHEYIHALTLQKLLVDQALYDKWDAIYVDAKYKSKNRNLYGFTNVYEFLAELISNPEFQQELNSIPADETQSVWTKVLAFIQEIFDLNHLKLDVNSVLNKAIGEFQKDFVPTKSNPREVSKWSRKLFDKLTKEFGIKVFISKTAEHSSYKGDTIIIAEKKLQWDTYLHEVSHPIIYHMYKYNLPLFNEMIKDITKAELIETKLKNPEYTEDMVLMEILTNRLGEKLSNTHDSLWAYVKFIIGKLFGRSRAINQLSSTSTLDDLAAIISEGKYKPLALDSTPLFYQRIEGLDSLHANKPTTILEDLSKQQFTSAKNAEGVLEYFDKDGNVVESFSTFTQKSLVNEELSIAEWSARREITSIHKHAQREFTFAPDETYNILGEEKTYADIVKVYKDKYEKSALLGTIGHKFIESLVVNFDDTQRDLAELELDLLQKQFLMKYGGVIDQSWVAKSVVKAFKFLGIDSHVAGEEVNPKYNDKVVPEKIVYSKLLNLATTTDAMVVKRDGSLMLLDWKFWGANKDGMVTSVLNHSGILNTKANKAKLSMAFRAFALKELNPDVRFTEIAIVSLNKNFDVPHLDRVELDQYLELIANYLKATNPDAWAKASELGLFKASGYYTFSAKTSDLIEEMKHLTLRQQLDLAQAKLNNIILTVPPDRIKQSEHLQAKVSELTKFILEVSNKYNINLNKDTDDITIIKSLVSNLADIDNPMVQAYSLLVTDAKYNANKKVYELESKFNKLLERLKAERGYTRGWTLESTREIYNFMWKYDSTIGRTGWYMNTTDSVYDKLGNAVRPMTPLELEFRDFVQSTFSEQWASFANKIVYNKNDKETTMSYLLGIPDKLSEDFMPRYAATNLEKINKYESVTDKLGQFIKNTIVHNFTDFLERTFHKHNLDYKGLPINGFYATQEDYITRDELHTFDVETIFKGFTKEVIYKRDLDDVYSIGIGLSNFLRSPEYINKTTLADFVEKQVFMNVLGMAVYKDEKVISSKINIKINDKVSKALGIPIGVYNIAPIKLMDMLKHWVNLVSLGLSLKSAIINGIAGTAYNYIRAAAGSVAKLRGAEYVPISLSTMARGHIQAISEIAMGVLLDKPSKLETLARKFNYVNFAFDTYHAESKVIQHPLSKLSSDKLFIFHGLFEQYNSYSLLLAQLKGFTFTNTDGKTMSMWDAFDSEGNWIGGKRGIVEQGIGKFTDLGEITGEEIKSLKREFEKLHGSYREDERVGMEASLLGQLFIQLKRYWPSILKLTWMNTKVMEDYTQSYYKAVRTIKNGDVDENVYELQANLAKGRIWVLLSAFNMNFMNKKHWDSLPDATKQDFINAMLTAFITLSLTALSYGLFAGDDDDEDLKYTKLAYTRIAEDISQGMNPLDLTKPLSENTFPVFSYIKNVTKAFSTFMSEGVIKNKTNRKGLRVGEEMLYRQIPVISRANEINKIFKEWDNESVILQNFDALSTKAR